MSQGAKIQLLDLPGIIEGAKDGKGRGRQIISTARTCNVLMIVLDVNKNLTDRYIHNIAHDVCVVLDVNDNLTDRYGACATRMRRT